MTISNHSIEYNRFKNLLVLYRKKKGYTQLQVSKMLNRHQSFVSKYESGERRLDFVEFMELTKVLEINYLDAEHTRYFASS